MIKSFFIAHSETYPIIHMQNQGIEAMQISDVLCTPGLEWNMLHAVTFYYNNLVIAAICQQNINI